MRHKSDRFPTLRARLIEVVLASERRGEQFVSRVGDRVTDSLARLRETTAWIETAWATWRHGDPGQRSNAQARSSDERREPTL
jgi:hypothetical protein